jgi:hypothetical protein
VRKFVGDRYRIVAHLLTVKASIFLGALGFLVASLILTSNMATGYSAQVNTWVGFSSGAVYNYGWHHNDNNYSAMDFSGPAEGTAVKHQASLSATQTDDARFVYYRSGSCKVIAYPQYEYTPGGWATRSGVDVHYLHMDNRIADGSHSPEMDTWGESVSVQIGTNGNCGTSAVHLHQSGNIYSDVEWAFLGADSCWGDSTYYCPGSSWKADNGGVCPPSGWSGTAVKSGTIPRYECQTWSIRSAPGASNSLFYLWW